MKKNDRVTLRITDISRNGEGIGRADGFALFVKDTVPGDLVEAGVMKMKKTYGYARMLRVLEPSPDRTDAPCPVAKKCGGCRLQMMKYESQLRMKEETVRNVLERIGGFSVCTEDDPDERPAVGSRKGSHVRKGEVILYKTVPSDPYFRYRNKAVIPVGADREGKPAAGFYAAHSHTIVPCVDCLLGPEENARIVQTIFSWMEENKIPSYNEKNGTGLIRHIFLRKSRWSGQFQLCLIVNGKSVPAVKQLKYMLDDLRLSSGEPLIRGACFSVNTRNTNVIFGGKTETLWGDPVLRDRMYAEKYGFFREYRISPASFYQVNPNVAEKMYEEVLDGAALTGVETVFDLYCGTGTISLFLAGSAKQVIGVETVPEAVRDAKENARLNGLDNVWFVEGKAEEVVPELMRTERIPADVVVVDPPRKGCDAVLLETILQMRPGRIVYVSCDPATLARDLRILCEGNYRLESVRPYDQFAMGVHCEAVAVLSSEA